MGKIYEWNTEVQDSRIPEKMKSKKIDILSSAGKKAGISWELWK